MGDGAGTGGWEGSLSGTGRSSFTNRLDRWLADARVDDAALQRTRERWLRAVAEQEATFTGVLADLAERHAGLAVATTAGRRHVGGIEAIGADFVALRTPGGAPVLVALACISAVRTAPSVESTIGDRVIATELHLGEVLGEMAADRERVVIVDRSGTEVVSGELRSVGRDVAVVRTDTDPPASAYVPLASIAEVTVG